MKKFRVNQQIRVPEVFLIDENGQSIGVMPTAKALSLALEAGLDVVEVNPKVQPPVVKIIDYGQCRYKKEKEAQKQKVTRAALSTGGRKKQISSGRSESKTAVQKALSCPFRCRLKLSRALMIAAAFSPVTSLAGWRRILSRRWLKKQWRILQCRIRRRLFCSATVIAVTGSCGKTSTTHFLGKILSAEHSCRIGISDNGQEAMLENLRRLNRSHRFVLQETGVNGPGSLNEIVPILRPHIGIVTSIGQDHYRNFRTLEATAAEKGILIESLPDSGVAVLNADDPYVIAMASRTKARILTYGLSDRADVRATDIRSTWPERLSLTVTYQGTSIRIETGLFGTLLSNSVLAAVSGALAAGIGLKQCAAALKSVETFSRRMAIHSTSRRVWYILDTVKAPYWSIGKVLALMADVDAPRKTVVIGSFSDAPGSDSDKYRCLARDALNIADRVLFVGRKAIHINKMLTAETHGRLFAMESLQEAAKLLADDVVADEVVLIKSGNLEHAERLYFSQDNLLRCWKPSCRFRSSCEYCTESGLSG
ncbi:MAG TPA: translation initiation factor IF-3 [Verrucomicrobiota bacterium]|jgi:UDP-N-acetylmuramoyl-tripeptide--D-alanyl-D-alanine ligase|nr:translation initiation factor IF-3 [Verrucomicrobiota bacterium]HCL91357.1 translation initiation factor IF-3 [Limisphaerales bacterium]HRY57392.1 translation initiation factor IF-3 [Candidatus Paceibacterota bacterium]HNR70747.1 translation initiation factor IF-3 [Verrucomicrobiota bacterium]HNS69386.1 translation initiation factor IF-3 [Verrucomicrobiota bacterium]